jgi:hypothetical protein
MLRVRQYHVNGHPKDRSASFPLNVVASMKPVVIGCEDKLASPIAVATKMRAASVKSCGRRKEDFLDLGAITTVPVS